MNKINGIPIQHANPFTKSLAIHIKNISPGESGPNPACQGAYVHEKHQTVSGISFCKMKTDMIMLMRVGC